MGKDKKDISKNIPLKFEFSDNIRSNFVTNMIVQNQFDYFTISFFETSVPPILGDTDDQKKEVLESIDYVKARCVSKLIVTPEKMKTFIDVMNKNYSDFIESKK